MPIFQVLNFAQSPTLQIRLGLEYIELNFNQILIFQVLNFAQRPTLQIRLGLEYIELNFAESSI